MALVSGRRGLRSKGKRTHTAATRDAAMGPSILLGAPGRDQDRPGEAQLILLALTGELDSQAFFLF